MEGRDRSGQLSSRTHIARGSDNFARIIIKIYPLEPVKSNVSQRCGDTAVTRTQAQSWAGHPQSCRKPLNSEHCHR